MVLTDKNLVEERDNPIGGTQRCYEVGRFGLSLINASIAHAWPFAWEAAVLRDGKLVYDTPLTSDVEVFSTDEEANEFIEKAFAYFESQS